MFADQTALKQIDDNIGKCHAKEVGEDQTENSWKGMIRVHQVFVDTQFPNLDADTGGRLAVVGQVFDKVLSPLIAAGGAQGQIFSRSTMGRLVDNYVAFKTGGQQDESNPELAFYKTSQDRQNALDKNTMNQQENDQKLKDFQQQKNKN